MHKTETDMLISEHNATQSKLMNNIDTYVSKVNEFEQENESKNREINALKASIKELRSNLQLSKIEQTRMDSGMTAENKALIAKLSDVTRQMNVLKDEKQDLVKLTKEKDLEISELFVKIESLTERKVCLEQFTSQRSNELNKSKEIENTLKCDIVKANDIIRKFQLEACEMNTMLKNQSVEMSKLQHELGQRDELLSEQGRRCSYFENIVKPQKEKIEMLSRQINALIRKLAIQEANKEDDERSKQPKEVVSQGCQTTILQSDPCLLINPLNNIVHQSDSSTAPIHSHQQSPVSLDERYLEKHPRCFIRRQPEHNMQEERTEKTDTVRNNRNWKPFAANAT